jgi:hypothetical protein
MKIAHARVAGAQDEEPARVARFGDVGQIVLTSAAVVGIEYERIDNADFSTLGITFAPGVDWFVADRLSIGVGVGVTYFETRNGPASFTSTSFGAGPRIGWAARLGERVTFYPRLGVSASSIHTTVDFGSFEPEPSASSSTKTIAAISCFAPLLFPLSPSFFVGFGPEIHHQFGDAPGFAVDEKEHTTIAFGTVVGGAFGGEATETSPEPAPRARFGEAHQLVLTGEAGFAASYAFHDNEHRTTVALAPGADYFIVNHVSLGATLSFTLATSGSSGEDTIPAVPANGSTIAIGPRVGLEIPVASNVSIYPRAFVVFGSQDVGHSGHGFSSVGLYAPALVHVAEHFFTGFGPYVERDLTRVGENATRVGASLVVGGWL